MALPASTAYATEHPKRTTMDNGLCDKGAIVNGTTATASPTMAYVTPVNTGNSANSWCDFNTVAAVLNICQECANPTHDPLSFGC
ncbi:hypothetical protein [Nocardia sp. NPDC051463]|uniref:hypothetical protein n=1 Tax=Nocardia sp. NPDC051463 TaxID=3154845 RepID=UPI00344754D2